MLRLSIRWGSSWPWPSIQSSCWTINQELRSNKNHCICFNGCVAVPKDTIWPIEPHTSAKHQILRNYLDAWLPILGKYNRRIVYIDGFSGPGEYAGGEPGSPIIALEAA